MTALLTTAQARAGLRGHLFGLTLSTAGSSTTFSVAAGDAANSTAIDVITLASAISKTTSAWVAGTGNGGLDTGSIAANTWYHAFIIKNPTTYAVDALVSLSPTAPTLPSGYTLFRRIGSMRTNSSSQWTKFVQLGDEFLWADPALDINGASIGTTSILATVSVPTGVQVSAMMRVGIYNASSAVAGLFSSPDENAIAGGSLGTNYTMQTFAAGQSNFAGTAPVRTNTSAQIRVVMNAATSLYYINTYGWIDTRGRDS